MSDASNWLAQEWAEKLGPAISAMTGAVSHAAAMTGVPLRETGQELYWRQALEGAPEAAIQVCISGEVWQEAGREVLRAAGLDEGGGEETRGTFIELLQQSLSQLTGPLGSRLGREVSFAAGELSPGERQVREWQPVQVSIGGRELGTAWIAGTEPLLHLLSGAPRQQQAEGEAGRGTPSKGACTLDLLMEVELPVGVSFGRAQMRLKDAIKLTTGSIVELNRSVSEPVEVVVNNCVIARGEVVVVEGNYGVRIQEIISREERLRTLF